MLQKDAGAGACEQALTHARGTGKKEFLSLWKRIPDETEQALDLSAAAPRDMKALRARLERHRVFYIADREVAGKGHVVYLSFKLRDTWVLLEITSACRQPCGCSADSLTAAPAAQLATATSAAARAPPTRRCARCRWPACRPRSSERHGAVSPHTHHYVKRDEFP